MSKKTQRTLELVGYKSHYMPANLASYRVMESASLTMLIFHKDFLPTFDLVRKRHNINIVRKSWHEVYDTWLAALTRAWESKPNRVVTVQNGRLIFTSKATTANREAMSRLNLSLNKFFSRWSFNYNPTFSETPTRFKLNVEFHFNPKRGPVMPIVSEETKQSYELVLGFTKLRVTIHKKPTPQYGGVSPIGVLEVFTATGSDWTTVSTSTFIPSRVEELGGLWALFQRLQAYQEAPRKPQAR